MDRKFALLVVFLILALIAFYFANPRNTMLDLNNNKVDLGSNSASPADSASPSGATVPAQSPDSSPVASPTTLPGGLVVQDITVGSGAEAKSGDTVLMNYVGTLENGQKFDSSYDRNQPFMTQIGVGQVIQGWDEGVPGMKVGGKRKLIIPAALGYGSQAVGSIPPNSTLVFEVELLQVK